MKRQRICILWTGKEFIVMELFKKIVKGIMIGIANAIPGVSGGTMMVSMGIYDEIISCVTGLFKHLKKSILTLLPYIIGMGLGIVGLARIIEFLFSDFPLQTSCLFIGLILGGLPILLNKVKEKKLGLPHAVTFLIFFALIIGMQLLEGVTGTEADLSVFTLLSVLQLFFVGIIASATMVIPGVSGSMMLMVLGYYEPIIAAVNQFINALVALDFNTMLTLCGSLVPFGLGVVIGIFAIAKAIEILLEKQETLTYSAILGLVAASPIVILMGTAMPAFSVVIILTSLVAFGAGLGIALTLGK